MSLANQIPTPIIIIYPIINTVYIQPPVVYCYILVFINLFTVSKISLLEFVKNKFNINDWVFISSILKKFVNLRQSENEIKHRLEQLRAIDNGININVVYSKNKYFGIDRVEDYVEIKKIMEYKIKKLWKLFIKDLPVPILI